MEEPQFKIGDVVRHTHLSKTKNLYVANVADYNVLVRYIANDKIETVELFTHELELVEGTGKKEIDFGW